MMDLRVVAVPVVIAVVAGALWLSGVLELPAVVAGAAVSSAPMTRTIMQGGEIGIMPMSRLVDPQTGVACYTSGNHFACVMIGQKLATELSRLK